MLDQRHLLLAAASILAALATPRAAGAQSKDPSLTHGGAATPTPILGGEIDGVPNAGDLEIAVAGLAVTSDKTSATASFAPLLIPGRYLPVLSEARLGLLADSSGSSSIGLSFSLNQPRMRLTSCALDPKCGVEEAAPKPPVPDPLEDELERLNAALCERATSACRGSEAMACREVAKLCVAGSPRPPRVILLDRMLAKVGDIPSPPAPAPPSLAPPSPPPAGADAPALAAHLAQLTEYLRKVEERQRLLGDYQERAAAFGQLPALRASGGLLRDAYQSAHNTGIAAEDSARIGDRQLRRLEMAYDLGSVVTLSGAVGFFPLFVGPDIATTSGAPLHQGSSNAIRRLDLSLGYRLYFTRRATAQVRGGYRVERADATQQSDLLPRGLVGVDAGFFWPTAAKPDAKGFQSGVGLGLSGTMWFCGVKDGCLTTIGSPDPAYGDSKGRVPLARRAETILFLEWRVLQAAQVRVGVDLRFDTAQGHIDRTAANVTDTTMVRATPIVAVGSSFWGI